MDSNEVKKSMAIAIAGGITISFAPTLYILSEANPLTTHHRTGQEVGNTGPIYLLTVKL